MEEYLQLLKSQFNNQLKIELKRPGIYQLLAPLFHEDGDLVEIYFEKIGDKQIRLSDFGMSLMRLSYSFEIDSPNKERILEKLVLENHLQEDNGVLSLVAPVEDLYPSVMQFAQGIAKVSNLDILSRENVKSLFDEMLEASVYSLLGEYSPKKDVHPIPDREELTVDYSFEVSDHPIYLFGIKDKNSARLATINCLEFRAHQLPFRGFAVHDDLNSLPRKDQKLILNACDKQFPTLEDFQRTAVNVFQNEAQYLSL